MTSTTPRPTSEQVDGALEAVDVAGEVVWRPVAALLADEVRALRAELEAACAPQPAVQDGEDVPSFCPCTADCGGVAVDPSCPIAQAKVRAGEDVPARLDAVAEALALYPAWATTADWFRMAAEELREDGPPDVRAAVAAALARPTGASS